MAIQRLQPVTVPMCAVHEGTPILEGPAGQEYCPRCASVEVEAVDAFQLLARLTYETRQFANWIFGALEPATPATLQDALEEAEDYIESVVGS